jgi:hypothetical protein
VAPAVRHDDRELPSPAGELAVDLLVDVDHGGMAHHQQLAPIWCGSLLLACLRYAVHSLLQLWFGWMYVRRQEPLGRHDGPAMETSDVRTATSLHAWTGARFLSHLALEAPYRYA